MNRKKLLFLSWVTMWAVCSYAQDSSQPALIVNTNDPSITFDDAIQKAHSYGATYPDSGLVWMNIAKNIAIENKDITDEVKSLVNFSQFYFWNSSYDKSVKAAQKAGQFTSSLSQRSHTASSIVSAGRGAGVYQ